MTLKSKVSRIVLVTVLCVFLFSAVSVLAQRTTIRKSVTGRVASRNEVYRGNLSSDENEIYNLINDERRKKGLGELGWDNNLAQMARSYSKKMAKESFFSHYDSDGNTVVDRVQDSNIRGWRKIGENLFFCEGYNDFDLLAVRGWMNSPEHRQNILDRQFTTTGIGVAQARNGQIYITQVFIKD
jgi:uncharacterized protein YkwD